MLYQDQTRVFEEWRSRPHHAADGSFVEDGPVDRNLWENSPRRILFLMKEAYGKSDNPNGWNLPDRIREEWKGPSGAFLWNLSRWTFGILHSVKGEIPAFQDGGKFVSDSLFQCAIVNIKKSAGSSRSTYEDLVHFAEKDGDLVARQINSLQPHVIVCGSTWELWKSSKTSTYRNIGNFSAVESCPWVERDGDRILINFWHPSAQFPKELLYYGLMSYFQFGLR